MNIISRDFAKRIDLYDVLERVCEELEPTQTQQDRARNRRVTVCSMKGQRERTVPTAR